MTYQRPRDSMRFLPLTLLAAALSVPMACAQNTTIPDPAPRIPRTEMGIAQLPNEKLDWFLDA